MQTQDQLSPEEQAQQIWDQLDREEATGAKAPTPEARTPEPQRQEDQASEPAATAPAEHHIADVADANSQAEVSPETQALLDRIAGQEAQMQQLTQRLRQAEGHIGGLKSQLTQAAAAAQRVTAAGGEAPSAKQIVEAQKSPEAMKRLKEDYPEFGSYMEEALNERLAGIEERLRGVSTPSTQPQPDPAQRPLTAADMESMREEIRREMQVEMHHEGWKDTVKQPAFLGWLQRQQPEVQMLAASESPRDAIRLLDLYGEARSTTQQRTQRLNSAAAMPNGRQARGPRQKSLDEMTPDELWKYLDEKDAAEAASAAKGF